MAVAYSIAECLCNWHIVKPTAVYHAAVIDRYIDLLRPIDCERFYVSRYVSNIIPWILSLIAKLTATRATPLKTDIERYTKNAVLHQTYNFQERNRVPCKF